MENMGPSSLVAVSAVSWHQRRFTAAFRHVWARHSVLCLHIPSNISYLLLRLAHEMKLHWAVVSVLHSWLTPALSLPQKKLVWVQSGPCIFLLLMKALLSLASWPGVYCTASWSFFFHHSRDEFSWKIMRFILRMSQSAWLSPGCTDQHTRFRRHGGKLGLWRETFVIKLTPEMETFPPGS